MRVREREQDLWAACKAGDEAARQQLILKHQGLVYHLMRGRPWVLESERDDLAQEGLIGLIKAIDRFEPERGGRFAPFACPWIEGAMKEYLRRLDWLKRADRERIKATGEVPIELLPLSVLDEEYQEEEGSDASVIVLSRLGREWLWEQVGRLLHGRDRETILSYYRDEIPGADLARSWQQHPASFSKRHRQALHLLAASLEEP